ncbi:MAG: hypothetical protein K0S77_3211, partial [Pseudomonas sp.]|nr:hypothetical protein [Pseudomonas sp.]
WNPPTLAGLDRQHVEHFFEGL